MERSPAIPAGGHFLRPQFTAMVDFPHPKADHSHAQGFVQGRHVQKCVSGRRR